MVKATVQENLQHLPEQVLFALARNGSASREYRKAATAMLLDKTSDEAKRYAAHPELASFVLEVKAEHEARIEVEAIVEAAVEDVAPPTADSVDEMYQHELRFTDEIRQEISQG